MYGLCRIIILLMLALLWSVSAFAAPADQSQLIKVGLWDNQQSVLISADSDFVLVGKNNEQAARFAAKEKVAVAMKAGQLTINGQQVKSPELSVQPVEKKANFVIEVNKRRYWGKITLRISTRQSGVTVINTIDIEQYLYGIVAREISPDWPLEAIKAQAVAARSYALHNLKKHRDDGYDVCATTDCQVYSGIDKEAARSTQAVNETRGLVLRFDGQIIPAFFHSSSGGFTENSENVWGTALPYIRGVIDYDQQSPHFRWSKEITPQELDTLLAKAGYSIGNLQAVTVSDLGKPPISSSDRGISGRVKSIGFTGAKGSVLLTGNRLRSLLGLNSTLFDVKIITPAPAAIDVPITDAFGDKGKKKIEINVKPMEQTGYLMDQSRIHRITGRNQEKIVFSGYGWGHGLGLSQWGAKAMADKAPAGDTTYFRQILKHYYQGVDIVKLY